MRELPSTFTIAFTFDFFCSVEGLQSVTQQCGCHRSGSLPWRKQISRVVSHSCLLVVFFTGAKTHAELNTEHQLQLGGPRQDHFSHGNNFVRIWLGCTV